MQTPWFYEPHATAGIFILSEASAKHAVQVLRLRNDDAIIVTNGNGLIFSGSITSASKKQVSVNIRLQANHEKLKPSIRLAVSPLRNASRFEWLLEKAGELGVSEFIPILCNRTVKTGFREDRMKNILISAMLQSQQAWLCNLSEPKKIDAFIKDIDAGNAYLAHCNNDESKILITAISSSQDSITIIIGPEGDFDEHEILLAKEHHLNMLSLGNIRLRTETAAIAALAALRLS